MLNTAVGWTIILALAGFWYYTNKQNTRQNELNKIAAQKQRAKEREEIEARKDSKAKRQRKKSFTEAPKQAPSQPKAENPAPAKKGKATKDSSDDDDALAFARQYQQAKEGTKFSAKAANEQRQKSVKQSRAQDKESTAEKKSAADIGKVSAPSSTAGVDADDDESSTTSPVVAAADASGVSDMLERTTSGPSVLKLTDTEEKKRQSKPAKAPQAVETKKQRQNRKKVEQAQAARAEEEKERKVKMEAQRRAARESEGRAAKDGSVFTNSAPKNNAWADNGVNGNSQPSESSGGFLPVQPLDTLENGASKTAAPKVDAPKSNGNAKNLYAGLPTEEEQMRMIQEEQDWNTVSSKKGKKKNGVVADVQDSAAPPSAAAPAAGSPPKKENSAATARPTKTFAHQSSFAALGDDGAEDVEEEWEV